MFSEPATWDAHTESHLSITTPDGTGIMNTAVQITPVYWRMVFGVTSIDDGTTYDVTNPSTHFRPAAGGNWLIAEGRVYI